MKPYDRSNSLIRRVKKRMSEFLPNATWMTMLLGESHAGDDDASSSNESDDQPPIKKLCTSNNSFLCVDSSSADKSSRLNVLIPEISNVTCLPSTSKQSPKFTSQSNSSTFSHDFGSKSSLKRKSDAIDVSNIRRPSQKELAFKFASSTPALVTTNKQPIVTNREKESQSVLKLRETKTKHVHSPSFKWDTFFNYGELSERQKLFAQKSPLNCTQVLYGGRSACTNLSKILGHSPSVHKKTTIPISPNKNSEIRTTSSVLLEQISTKDKVIEENKFIIPPKTHLKHKADQKSVPVTFETTVNVDTTTPKITEDKSNSISSIHSGRDSSRKLKANISKKARGLQSDEFEMPAKVDLPDISLSVPVLPCINLSTNNSEDNEFTFNQPLTLEQFSSQIVEKSYDKQNSTLKKTPTFTSKLCCEDQESSPIFDVFTKTPAKTETKMEKAPKKHIMPEISVNVDKKSVSPKFCDSSKIDLNASVQSSGDKSESPKPTNIFFENSPQVFKTTNNNQQQPDKSVELKKWSCDTCWVSNDGDKLNCVACQTPKTSNSQKPIITTKPLISTKSSTWTCETCWVPNKNEVDTCVACQTQKLGTTKIDQSWKCDNCWVKNKYESSSCISCGTVKPGSVQENKPQLSTQFDFGLNKNTFDKSADNQNKLSFGSKVDQSSNQFKFGSPVVALTKPEDKKSDSASPTKFKFGVVENKSEQPFGTFKFGYSDALASQPEKNLNLDQPPNQFKFDIEQNSDQPESKFKFGFNSTTNVPTSKFKFGSDSVEKEKSVQQNCLTDCNKTALTNTNDTSNETNNKNGKSAETLCAGSSLKFGDTKVITKSVPQFTFGSVVTNCNDSNTTTNNENKNEDVVKEQCVPDFKEIKPISFGMTQTIPSNVESTYPVPMVNGHSHQNEDQKPDFTKNTQLFSFGSLNKQDKNLPGVHNTFTFGSITNDNKSFASPALTTSSFLNSGPVFGTSNSMFGNGPTTTSPSLGSSTLAPLFSFGGSIAPNSTYSQAVKSNDNPLRQNSNSFISTTKVNFSFDAQSKPVFSPANTAGLFTSSAIQANSQPKNVSNNLFNQSITKPSVNLDPNAPISINFTGGATTQFTAKPETAEPPTKRKILKPVRRIR